MDELLKFLQTLRYYVDEKSKVQTNISQLLKVLQNQIDHHDYVKKANPSKDFLTKFENVQTIVLEKVTKRIETEMKNLIILREQNVSLYNEFKNSARAFIKTLKNEDYLKGSVQMIDRESVDKGLSNQSLSSSRGKSKRKSNTSLKEKSNDEYLGPCITQNEVCVLQGLLSEVIQMENMNIIKLMQMNNYEMVKDVNIDEFVNTKNKYAVIEMLLRCFSESYHNNTVCR